MHTTMKKTPTQYSEMLDHLSPNLETGFLRICLVSKRRFFTETRFLCVSPISISMSDFARSLAFQDSVLPELGFMRYMAVNLDTKQAALVLAREGDRFEAVCHQP